MKLLLPIAVTLASIAAAAPPSGIPPAILPSGVGVNIHFTRGREADLDKIAAAGFRFIRMDLVWRGIERGLGVYDWSAYDELTDGLERRGLRAIYILDYSNPLYEEAITVTDKRTGEEREDVASPRRPESVAAFARWAAAAAARYRGRGVIWEIWNEPNIHFWKPEPDARASIALARATARAIREVDPGATIVAPASSGFPWEFFETLFASGLLEDLDAVSVHPYRAYGKPPESAAVDYARLRGLIARAAPPGKERLPILSGEWGYATHDKGITPELQAAFIVRQQVANLLEGVPLSIWYDWKNDGTDPTYNEHNFGTVDHRLDPKPAYHAVQEMTRELAGYRVALRFDTVREEDWALLCVAASGEQKLVAWTAGAPHAIALDADGRELLLPLRERPAYTPVRPPSRAWKLAAAWEAEPEPGARMAVDDDGVARIVARVTNPLDAPLRVEFAADDAPAPVSVDLPARGSARATLRVPAPRRDREMATIQVRARFRERIDGAWRSCAHSSRRVAFAVAHPLSLSVAPSGNGLRATIQNPTGVAFDGRVVWGQTVADARVSEGARQRAIGFAAPATSEAIEARLLDREGRVVAEAALAPRAPVGMTGFRAALDGDPKIAAKAGLVAGDAPPGDCGAPHARAFRLDYDFAEGWRFVRCVPDPKPGSPISASPGGLGLWVFGDGSGNALKCRLTDATRQTFQFGAGRIDWTGWRWVTFDLDPARAEGHWGGANDGVAHAPLRWDCPLLLDGSRRKTAGAIWFAGLTSLGGL